MGDKVISKDICQVCSVFAATDEGGTIMCDEKSRELVSRIMEKTS